jgi:nickel-type superoxide dismutase maturation protease
MFGLSRVVVEGNSMAPAYNQGDWLIVRGLSGQEHRLKIGKIYLISDPIRPGVKLLKRLTQTRIEHGVIRFWVEGDNPDSTDSRSWGWLDASQILGKVLLRYKKVINA